MGEAQVRGGPDEASGPTPSPHDAFTPAVSALRREVEDLRHTARERAVVEQAKGVLLERHGLTLDEAAERLRALAHEQGRPIGVVAADVLGVRPPAREGDDGAAPRASGPAPPAGTTPEGDEAARFVLLLAETLGAVAVVLYRLAADGSLRLVGSDGMGLAHVTPWSSIPPEVDVPLARAVTRGRSVFLATRADRDREFPLMGGVASPARATASVPVFDDEGPAGVVGIVWDHEHAFDEATERAVENLVRAVGPVLLRPRHRADADLATVGAVLDLLGDPWLLLRPAEGVEFEVALVSPRVPGGRRHVGALLSAVWPATTAAPVGAMLACTRLYGGPSQEAVVEAASLGLPLAHGPTRVRVTRLGADVVLHWRSEQAAQAG